MNRITPSMVLDAFKKFPLKVVKGTFYEQDTNGKIWGLCPLACTLAQVVGFEEIPKIGGPGNDFTDYLKKFFDLDRDYAWGFIDAMDDINISRSADTPEHRRLGYSDGLAVKAVLEEAGLLK